MLYLIKTERNICAYEIGINLSDQVNYRFSVQKHSSDLFKKVVQVLTFGFFSPGLYRTWLLCVLISSKTAMKIIMSVVLFVAIGKN